MNVYIIGLASPFAGTWYVLKEWVEMRTPELTSVVSFPCLGTSNGFPL